MKVETALGAVVDRIAILRLKVDRLPEQAAVVAREELDSLLRSWEEADVPDLADLPEFTELIEVNTALWDVEDRLRAMERSATFDESFVAAARSVYRLNDRRASLKSRVDVELGSRLTDPKWYTEA